MVKKVVLTLLFSLLILHSKADAALIQNGSFENGIYVIPGTFTTIYSGALTNQIDNWVVTRGSVDYINDYWKASEGTHSVDLNGLSMGSVSQTFGTVTGQAYKVLFDLAGNPDGKPLEKIVRVSDAINHQDYTFDITGHNHQNMGWLEKEFIFTANSDSTELSFASLTDSCLDYWGPAIDNVRVSEVPTPAPEPSSMVLGFLSLSGILGLKRRRK